MAGSALVDMSYWITGVGPLGGSPFWTTSIAFSEHRRSGGRDSR
ncbi:hypothetical protein [Rhodococcus globerulus]|nr:hypothetical protein [Rhodococcus globerulus]